MVIPRDEKRATSSSKLIPPTPITSIMSAGLLRVLVYGVGREGERRKMVRRSFNRDDQRVNVYVYSPIERSIVAYS